MARGGLDPGALAVEMADIGIPPVELAPSCQARQKLSWKERKI